MLDRSSPYRSSPCWHELIENLTNDRQTIGNMRRELLDDAERIAKSGEAIAGSRKLMADIDALLDGDSVVFGSPALVKRRASVG